MQSKTANAWIIPLAELCLLSIFAASKDYAHLATGLIYVKKSFVKKSDPQVLFFLSAFGLRNAGRSMAKLSYKVMCDSYDRVMHAPMPRIYYTTRLSVHSSF